MNVPRRFWCEGRMFSVRSVVSEFGAAYRVATRSGSDGAILSSYVTVEAIRYAPVGVSQLLTQIAQDILRHERSLIRKKASP